VSVLVHAWVQSLEDGSSPRLHLIELPLGCAAATQVRVGGQGGRERVAPVAAGHPHRLPRRGERPAGNTTTPHSKDAPPQYHSSHPSARLCFAVAWQCRVVDVFRGLKEGMEADLDQATQRLGLPEHAADAHTEVLGFLSFFPLFCFRYPLWSGNWVRKHWVRDAPGC
jgi:hypothetical protein